METSVIIRTKNEGAIFYKVLEKLQAQTYQNFEIIVVDDNSTDGSKELVFKFFSKNRAKVINVPKGKFTYPFSSNLGAKVSQGKYLVYISGHSMPISNTWLKDGLLNFKDNKVAGVFAWPLPNPNDNLFLKITGNFLTKLLHSRIEIYNKAGMGILGTTNAVIRKDLWEKYHFNQAYEAGGEDGKWAGHWMARGYVVIQDPKFRVYHSHNWSPIGMIKQFNAWSKLDRPTKFKRE